jgi:hypothetical protein
MFSSKSSVKLTFLIFGTYLFKDLDVLAITDELAKTMAVASESLENFMLSFSLSMEGALRN